MNIMYAKYSKDSNISVLALDARKASDQVEGKYIFSVIKEFGLGDNFTSWVEMLYARLTASVITNYDKSPTFLCILSVRLPTESATLRNSDRTPCH